MCNISSESFFRINRDNSRQFTLNRSSSFFFSRKMINLTFAIIVAAVIGGMIFSTNSISSVTAQKVIKKWSVNDPGGIVIDPKGNVYVVETGKDRILEFTANGTLIRAWGSGGYGNGQFNSPMGITLDYARGYVYVTDTGNNRIQKFTSNGTFIAKWGSPGSGPGQFQTPIGVDEDDPKQNVYVTDIGNNRVQRFTSNGLFVTQWGSLGSREGQFANPGRIAVDNSGDLFVADFGNNRIQKFDGNGKFIMQWGSLGHGNGQFYNPTGMTVQESQGNVYVADTGNSRIQEFTNDGKFINKWPINTATGAIDNIDLDVNSKGTIYVTDRAGNSIQVISPVPGT